jgi:hypothetical protein
LGVGCSASRFQDRKKGRDAKRGSAGGSQEPRLVGALGLPIIGKLLGHRHPGTTARHAHLDADPLRRASNHIGNAIAAAIDAGMPDVQAVAFRERKIA